MNGRLIRNTFCYGSELVPVQCDWGLDGMNISNCKHEIIARPSKFWHKIYVLYLSLGGAALRDLNVNTIG